MVARGRLCGRDENLVPAGTAGANLAAVRGYQPQVDPIYAFPGRELATRHFYRQATVAWVVVLQLDALGCGWHFEGQEQVEPLLAGWDVMRDFNCFHIIYINTIIGGKAEVEEIPEGYTFMVTNVLNGCS